MLGDRLLYHILSGLRTHVLIIGGENYSGFIFNSLGYGLYIDRSGNICAAMAHEYSYSLHGVFSFLTWNIYAWH